MAINFTRKHVVLVRHFLFLYWNGSGFLTHQEVINFLIAVSGVKLSLKGLQVTEARASLRIGYALIKAKMQVKILFVQYLNFNKLILN